MNRTSKRRRRTTWAATEIDQLIDLRLPEFRPPVLDGADRVEDLATDPEAQRQFRLLPAKVRLQFEEQAAKIRTSEKPEDSTPKRLMEIVEQVRCATPETKFLPYLGFVYLQAQLAHPFELKPARQQPMTDAERRRFRDKQLRNRSQLSCFLRWVDIDDDIWNDLLWRECLRARYEHGNAQIHAFFEFGSRKSRSPEEHGMAEQLPMTLKSFVAELHKKKDSSHSLDRPLWASGVFGKLFDHVYPKSVHPETEPGKRSRFLRYLTVNPHHPDALVGEVLYYLVALGDWFATEPPGNRSAMVQKLWPKPLTLPRPMRDYHRIGARYVKALQLPKWFFPELWSAYVKIMLHDFREQRSSTKLSVFWAARVLEELDPDIYFGYLGWIELFRKHVLKPLCGDDILTAKRIRWRSTVGPFCHALDQDPLLKCVFHAEIFRGGESLRYKRPRGNPGHPVVGLATALVVRELRRFYPWRKWPKVDEVFRNRGSLSPSVQSSLQTNEVLYGAYVFAAPLVTTMFNESDHPYKPEHIKEFHRAYRNRGELTEIPPLYSASEARPSR